MNFVIVSDLSGRKTLINLANITSMCTYEDAESNTVHTCIFTINGGKIKVGKDILRELATVVRNQGGNVTTL